jgi:hypothetical protein
MKHSQISQERIATYSTLMQLQYATNNGSQWSASEVAYLEGIWQNNTDGFGKKANLLLHVFLGYPLDELEPEVIDSRSALLESSNVTKAAALKLWPNPSPALLQLQLVEPQPQNCELTIVDLTGKLYHTQTIEKMQLEITLDVSALPCNNYVVALRDANGVLITSSPFIKN